MIPNHDPQSRLLARFRLAATLLALVSPGAAAAAPQGCRLGRPRREVTSRPTFAANPSCGRLRGPPRVRRPAARLQRRGPRQKEVGAARGRGKAAAAFDPASARRGPPHRARLPALGHRQEPVLAVEAKWPVPQSRLVFRRDRSGDLSQQAVCAARDAHAGVHRLRESAAAGRPQQIRANLRTPLAAPIIDYGVKAFGGYAEFFAKRRPSRLRVGEGSRSCRRSSPPR